MDAARELAQLLQRVRQLLARAREVGVVRMPARRQPQHQRERDEPLLRAVVQVALQPPALGVARGDDARARRGELRARLGVGQRLGGELGEVRDPLLGAGRRRLRVDAGDDHRAPQPPVEEDRPGDGRDGTRARCRRRASAPSSAA